MSCTLMMSLATLLWSSEQWPASTERTSGYSDAENACADTDRASTSRRDTCACGWLQQVVPGVVVRPGVIVVAPGVDAEGPGVLLSLSGVVPFLPGVTEVAPGAVDALSGVVRFLAGVLFSLTGVMLVLCRLVAL